MGLSAIFDNCLLPLAIEGGKCIFKLMLISGTYLLIRIEFQRGHEVVIIFWIVILRSQLNNNFITDK